MAVYLGSNIVGLSGKKDFMSIALLITGMSLVCLFASNYV
jgi:hypothetical protein